jgi:hypothetical protein
MVMGSSGGWNVLLKAYREKGIFLVLGSGVSYDSGVPSWPELLRRVCLRQRAGEASLPGKLHDMTPPVFASFLEERAGSREALATMVQHCLYESFPGNSYKPIDAQSGPLFVETIDLNNQTLRSVSALCARRAPTGEAYKFQANPRVQAVMTTNYDNLLQSHSRAKYGELTSRGFDRHSLILRTVERASAAAPVGKIGVYHVHGSIRYDKAIGDYSKHAPDLMVLTEQDFFDTFNNPTRLSTYTFLHLLREHTGLFIGLSMQDENLRRLLHYSKQERAESYRTEGEREGAIRGLVQRHVALLLDNGKEEVNDAHEATLAPLGVHVIWLQSFDEIETKLAKLYNSTRDSEWTDVY